MATVIQSFILDREEHALLEKAALGVRAVFPSASEEDQAVVRRINGLARSGRDVVRVERIREGVEILTVANEQLYLESQEHYWKDAGTDVNGRPIGEIFIPIRLQMWRDVEAAQEALMEIVVAAR